MNYKFTQKCSDALIDFKDKNDFVLTCELSYYDNQKSFCQIYDSIDNLDFSNLWCYEEGWTFNEDSYTHESETHENFKLKDYYFDANFLIQEKFDFGEYVIFKIINNEKNELYIVFSNLNELGFENYNENYFILKKQDEIIFEGFI